jgi:hypothetical protein
VPPAINPSFENFYTIFFEKFCVYVTFGVDYEYVGKFLGKLIFDHFLNFDFDLKTTPQVAKKFFIVIFVTQEQIHVQDIVQLNRILYRYKIEKFL